MKREQRENGTVIYLETEKDLRVYLHPLRQKILSVLERNPEGMSAKQIADTLGIAPSSAGHHLQTLEQAGLVELDRIEIIHGFRAKLYRNTPVTVSVGYFPQKAGYRLHWCRKKLQKTPIDCWMPWKLPKGRNRHSCPGSVRESYTVRRRKCWNFPIRCWRFSKPTRTRQREKRPLK